MAGTASLAPKTSRRNLLKSGLVLGGGLVVGFNLAPRAFSGDETDVDTAESFAPNAFVRIGPDDSVTIVAKHLEMGQGTFTGLATILAEELDADWTRVRVEAAPADAARYNNFAFGPVQGTGGSTAMAASWQQLRQAGATARAMLVGAAAASWRVPAGEIAVEKGVVRHAGSGRSARFGELVPAAALQPVPAEVALKDPKDFKLVGTSPPRVDVPAKTNGSAVFTLDVYLPDMLTAVIARPPRFGAKALSFAAAAALAVPGVVEVVAVPAGVAVLAKNFWAAERGRRALTVTWDERGAETRGSAELFAEYHALARGHGASVRREGDVEAAFAKAAKVLEAEYEFPFLAHAPMEPLDCVIHQQGDRCQVWAGSQIQTIDQGVVAGTLGLDPAKVEVHTLYAGGSFGRRATPVGDMVGMAASVVKAIGGRAPVKLVWTREDDVRGGMYRPLYVHRLKAGLDAAGNLVAWYHHVVGQSILLGTPFEAALVKDGIDATSIEGGSTLPYAIPNLGVELSTTKVGVPVLWWRSVGHTHTAYSTETFFDQVARAAGKDPVALRRQLLAHHPRHRGVLELAAEKAGWGGPLPAGRARGVAVHESFGSFVAQVAEVSLGKDGTPKVERVVAAVDCGTPINPDVIQAQIEGAVGYGLSAALHGEITLEAGRVAQSNFHDYRCLRMHEMPRVEVHVVPSAEPPSGVGEPGVPPIAPAVANALARLTTKPLNRLPLRRLA